MSEPNYYLIKLAEARSAIQKCAEILGEERTNRILFALDATHNELTEGR
jgi:hypothetical protein